MATTPAKRAGGKRQTAALDEYVRKRDFSATGEPATRRRRRGKASAAALFVVQKHAARRLHYDFRLELDGSLKSWAIPKGPSLDPQVRRLALQVEDHPLAYADFEGRIAEGQYGAGEVIVWDRGVWQSDDADPAAAYRAGKLKFHLLGDKLSGGWTLVRTGSRDAGKDQWLLIKERDAAARAAADFDILAARPESVVSHARLSAGEKAERTAESRSATQDEPPLGAKRAPLPTQMRPALATLVDAPPPGDWRYEIKFDGYRLLARIDGGAVQLFTRSGLDWTARLPGIADALRALGEASAWLDGEIVVVGADGLPDFQALQNAFEAGRTADVIYFLFDVPYLAGLDLRAVPLEARRARLRRLIEASGADCLRYSEDFSPARGDVLRSACALKLEGVIGKRVGSPYVSRRSSDWIKLKCKLRQEFVIGGYTDPQGSRTGFGALLLGVHDDTGALRYAGRVGTGFCETSLRTLHGRMHPLARRSSPFGRLPARHAAGVTWLEPRLVCEVEFAQWTDDALVRQAVFRGLREEKPGGSIVRERPVAAARIAPSPAPARRSSRPEIAGVRITHPDRVIDTETGFTKLALAECYRDAASHLLRHLAGRPVSLLRAPDGVAGSTFFQRHAGTLRIAAIRNVDAGPDEYPLMAIDNVEGLIGAVQMGAIEFHAWNADSARLEQPDGMVFDIDPDPSLPWERVIEATRLVLTLLDELGLASFLKTSGGKGMHILVPLARRHGWDDVKGFTKAVAQHLARILPNVFVDTMGPKHRVGKVFVDYLRNQKGASTVAAYSVRARPGLPVSMPIARDELDTVTGAAAWTVLSLAERLDALTYQGDPWSGMTHDQRITRRMRQRLGKTDP